MDVGMSTNIKKILYLSPLIPDISGNGGKRAIYNHLENLMQNGAQVKLFLVNVDGGDINIKYSEFFPKFSPTVFPRAMPRGSNGLWAKLIAIVQLIMGRLPRSVSVIASKQAKEEFNKLVAYSKFDVVVVDHLNAFGIVEGSQFSQPLIYIAHNIETDVLNDKYKIARLWSLEWIIAKVEYFKMLRFERRLIDKAKRIILISSGDLNSKVFNKVLHKISIWPELPSLRKKRWNNRESKSMLFVGSVKYFPNKEAIYWLVEKLMPEIHRLDSSIKLTIAGTSKEEVDLPDVQGVNFTGFVSDAILEELHLQSIFFICPVILGSGIKIKVLEASSYGVPIIATKESLSGIDFLSEIIPVLTRNPAKDAQAIISCLSNPQALDELSAKIISSLNNARAIRKPLVEEF